MLSVRSAVVGGMHFILVTDAIVVYYTYIYLVKRNVNNNAVVKVGL